MGLGQKESHSNGSLNLTKASQKDDPEHSLRTDRHLVSVRSGPLARAPLWLRKSQRLPLARPWLWPWITTQRGLLRSASRTRSSWALGGPWP